MKVNDWFCSECRSTECYSTEHAEKYIEKGEQYLREARARLEWLKSDTRMAEPEWCQFCGVKLEGGQCPKKETRHPNQ
jgi:hypothetical protein